MPYPSTPADARDILCTLAELRATLRGEVKQISEGYLYAKRESFAQVEKRLLHIARLDDLIKSIRQQFPTLKGNVK